MFNFEQIENFGSRPATWEASLLKIGAFVEFEIYMDSIHQTELSFIQLSGRINPSTSKLRKFKINALLFDYF